MPHPFHILYIDDDPMIRRLFGGKLSTAGYEVIYASDGNTGREMARRFLPDLILLDVNMPDTDGFTIAKRLRSEPRTKDIPVVFFTNQDFSLEAEKLMKELWVVGYIHKSVEPDEFIKQLQRIIQSLEAPAKPAVPEESVKKPS